jgi:hypothetical protein
MGQSTGQSGAGSFAWVLIRAIGIVLATIATYFVVGVAIQPFSEDAAFWVAPAAALVVAVLLVVMLARSTASAIRVRTLLLVAVSLAAAGGLSWLESIRETKAYPASSFAGFLPAIIGYALLAAAFVMVCAAAVVAWNSHREQLAEHC